jgi:hypothetical protein
VAKEHGVRGWRNWITSFSHVPANPRYVLEAHIAATLVRFDKTGERLLAYEIIALCLIPNPPIPFPATVLQYLQRISFNILDMAEYSRKPTKSWLVKALELGPGEGEKRNLSFTNYGRRQKRTEVYDWVFRQVHFEKQPLEKTILDAEIEFKVSSNTIRKWVREAEEEILGPLD